MNHVLIVGGGLAGCTAALELAGTGLQVTILEKTDSIGGKVRQYGCKATDRCNNCGLCLSGQLWERVEEKKNINIITNVQLMDLIGAKGDFKVIYKYGNGKSEISGLDAIIVTTGFKDPSFPALGSVEYNPGESIIDGYGLEKLLAERSKYAILAEKPKNIAFLQCFGSRDVQEKALYCSRVCCGYSTRAARVLRHYYPETGITFFYMDLQRVEAGDYFGILTKENMEFIRCRPVRILAGKPARIVYENPLEKGIVEREFDLVVLTGGIRPSGDSEFLSELFTLGLDDYGFLKYIENSDKTGIYVAGCASGPKRIEEVCADALTAARCLADSL